MTRHTGMHNEVEGQNRHDSLNQQSPGEETWHEYNVTQHASN